MAILFGILIKIIGNTLEDSLSNDEKSYYSFIAFICLGLMYLISGVSIGKISEKINKVTMVKFSIFLAIGFLGFYLKFTI